MNELRKQVEFFGFKFPVYCDDENKKENPRTKIIFKYWGKRAMASSEILNIKEVSNYLKIPVSTLYKLVQDGKVPAIKVGKHWRFMKRDLEQLFDQNRQENGK